MKQFYFGLFFLFLILPAISSAEGQNQYQGEINYLPKFIGAEGSPFLVHLNFQGLAKTSYRFSLVIRDRQNYSVKSQLWNNNEQKWQGGYDYQNFISDENGQFETWQTLKINGEISNSGQYEIFYRIKDENGKDLLTVIKNDGFQIVNDLTAGWLIGHIKSLNDRYNNKLITIIDENGNYLSAYWCENNGIADYDYDLHGDGYFKIILPNGQGYKIKAYEKDQKFWNNGETALWESEETYDIEAGKITSTDPNQPPIPIVESLKSTNKNAPFIFDASKSFDPEGKSLTYQWDLRDGTILSGEDQKIIEHTYSETGKYLVKLTVSDGELEKIIEQEISVLDIIISEILPSPLGSDTENEWVELYNNAEVGGDLEGWKIKDTDGLIKEYTLPPSSIINGKGFFLIKVTESKISLNDDQDGVILFLNDKEIDQASYSNPKENYSWARFENGWQWTDSPTSLAVNFFHIPLPDNSETETENIETYNPVDIREAYHLALGTKVRIQGQVSVLPGTFAKTYFYFQDQTGGIKIYQYYGYFPSFEIGDILIIEGEITELYGQRQIKIKNQEAIRKIDLNNESPFAPIYLSPNILFSNLNYRLVKLFGKIESIASQSFYLQGFDFMIYIKEGTGINLADFNLVTDQWIEVTGLLIPYKSGYQILPRSREDIAIKHIDAHNDRDGNTNGIVTISERMNNVDSGIEQEMGILPIKIAEAISRTNIESLVYALSPIQIAEASTEKGIIKGASTTIEQSFKKYTEVQFLIAVSIIFSLIWQVFLRKPT